jgi:glycosyltransferase involved in cell wall biosynthesis
VDSVALVVGTGGGGVGVHVRSLVTGLVAEGTRVDVYCPAIAESRFGFAAAGATVSEADPGDWSDVPGLRRLRRGLRERPPAVVHAHGLAAGLAAGLSRPDGLPLVVTWHLGVSALPQRLLARQVARIADVTIAVSPGLAAEATAAGGRVVRQVMAIAPELPPATVDAAALRLTLGVAPSAPVVLAAGRLHLDERHDVLVAAAARWRERRPVPAVLLAGAGPAYRRLAGLALVQHAPVTLIGPRDDVADLLAVADLAVVTAPEGGSFFIQHCLGAGVPLVAPREAGVIDLVGRAAELVAVGDVAALDAAVTSLLDSPARRAELVAAGRSRAALWPTPAEAFEQVLAVYSDLVPAGRSVTTDPRDPA